MSAEEKLCTLRKICERRSAASRVEMRAESTVEASEATHPTNVSTTMATATLTMTSCAPAATPLSIIRASRVGRPISVAAPKSVRTSSATTWRQSMRTYLKIPIWLPDKKSTHSVFPYMTY